MKRLSEIWLVLFLILCCVAWAPLEASAQTGDYGDAPEGALAYPATLTIGQFPTCRNLGPSGFVFHGYVSTQPNVWFGPIVDVEPDGNGGICPPPPYNQDECSPATDNDAGLTIPDPYTIVGGVVTPCNPLSTPRGLGTTCSQAVWGVNVDILVTNNLPVTTYVNVLMDWNQDGIWGGSSQCPTAAAREWVLSNFPVPAGFNGPLSTLGPPVFLIGPQSGFVWSRFTIAPQTMPVMNWDGSGTFTRGETEDYLLRVDEMSHEGDLGDAPEGAIAYPATGILGQFPTCRNIGPAGFVFHLFPTTTWFGPTADAEADGNSGVCPPPPYDQDECSPAVDNDAGLLAPDPYTIVGGVVTLCGQVPNPRALGTACTQAAWGPNVDIQVANNSTTYVYVNVLMDWDQNGAWSGSSQCPGGPAPEWVLVNFPVPGGFIGPLSGLGPAAFLIGPQSGYVWSRFTVTPQPIQATSWDGSGTFDMGESEDYLLRVDEMVHEGDMGDAPEGTLAYPATGILGQFPTCRNIGPAGFVFHLFPTTAWFGPTADAELDGNAGTCPSPPYDQDECSPAADNDAGLTVPTPFTIVGGVVTPCAQTSNPRALGFPCAQAGWGANVDIFMTNNGQNTVFVNVLFDWDQSGAWGGSSQCPAGAAPEWVMANFPVPPGFSGLLSALTPPAFLIGPHPGYVWSRFSITPQPLLLSDWDGSGTFDLGETEDYLLWIDDPASGLNGGGVPDARQLVLDQAQPNPSSPVTTIRWTMPAAAPVRVTVYDSGGRVRRRLVDQSLSAGSHTIVWDGTDDSGRPAGSGLYFLKVQAGREVRITKIVLVK